MRRTSGQSVHRATALVVGSYGRVPTRAVLSMDRPLLAPVEQLKEVLHNSLLGLLDSLFSRMVSRRRKRSPAWTGLGNLHMPVESSEEDQLFFCRLSQPMTEAVDKEMLNPPDAIVPETRSGALLHPRGGNGRSFNCAYRRLSSVDDEIRADATRPISRSSQSVRTSAPFRARIALLSNA
jgi:hypothetical protein